jgi:hypothetical protein
MYDRRTDQVLHDDHHQAQRFRCRSPRPDASAIDGSAVRALAKRGGGSWNAKTHAERLPTTLGDIEAGQQLEGGCGRCDADRTGGVGGRLIAEKHSGRAVRPARYVPSVAIIA